MLPLSVLRLIFKSSFLINVSQFRPLIYYERVRVSAL